MFRTTITETPFTSTAAAGVFENISGSPILGDVSFLASMRALLAPRLKEGDSVSLSYTSSRFRKADLDGVSKRDIVSAVCGAFNPGDGRTRGMFAIHNLRGDPEGNLQTMKTMEEKFTEVYAGYTRLDIITAFFRKSFPVVCFLNEERKNTVLFVENMDTKRMHYLQLAILPSVPWYFKPDDGITEEENGLLHAFMEKEPAAYQAALEKLAKNYDFRGARIRSLLSGFESKFERQELERARSDLKSTDSRIDEFNNNIKTLLAKRNDLCVKLMGLEQKIASGTAGGSEVMEYFLGNKRLYLEEVYDTDVTFSVKGYLAYYDRDAVERVLKNKNSYVFIDRSGNEYTAIAPARMVKLLKAVFLDEKLKLRICAAFRLSARNGVTALTNHAFPTPEFSGYMPNPHIDMFLNWGDSTVMRNFMANLYGTNDWSGACIELPDGSAVEPLEAIKWLEAQEKKM